MEQYFSYTYDKNMFMQVYESASWPVRVSISTGIHKRKWMSADTETLTCVDDESDRLSHIVFLWYNPKKLKTFFFFFSCFIFKRCPPSVTDFLLTVMCNPRCVPYVTYRTTMLYHVYLLHSSYNIVLLIYTALLSTHIEIQANMTIRVQVFFFLQILHKTLFQVKFMTLT